MRVILEFLEDLRDGQRLMNLLDEDIKEELKVPTWLKGYEAIWWAAVARSLKGEDPDSVVRSGQRYAAATQICKAYLKSYLGIDINDLKSQGQKPGKSVADAKASYSKGLRSGDSEGAAQMAKLAVVNKAYAKARQENGQDFVDAMLAIKNKYIKPKK